jgi:hypothetical protein
MALHVQHSIPNLTQNVRCVDQAVNKSFERVRTFQRDTSQVKSINTKIMVFIAFDNQLFSEMGDVGFRRLVEHRYMLPYQSYTVIASLLLASQHTMECRLGLWCQKKTDVKPHYLKC